MVMMVVMAVAAFAVKAAAVPEYDRYAGYLPSTRVTDEAALDLDQQELNAVLSYSQGGHAGSYARLTLTNIALQDDGDRRAVGSRDNDCGQLVIQRIHHWNAQGKCHVEHGER
jgi:hypothetical protein